MDIFSHGLWAGAAAKAINRKKIKPLSFWQAAWWGIFPDLLGFTPAFVWLFWNLIFNGLNLADLPTYQFYATPFLWPLSEFKFDGFSWASLWFLIPNYLVIIIVYLLLRVRKKNMVY